MVDLTCENCGTHFARYPSQVKELTFCSKACAYRGLTKAKPTARRNLYRPGHPIAGLKGYVAEHRLVLFERIGPGEHPCHWCGKSVHWTARLVGTGHEGMLVADHINGDEMDNRSENLVPSCQGCNATRARRIGNDELFVVRGGKRRRAVERACETCAHAFLSPADQVNQGRGRFCSRSCARMAPRSK